jgi:hypothetical protein
VALDPATVGYTVEEYFIEGNASSFTPVGELASSGRWNVTTGTAAPYKTRIVVWKPPPAEFNGTVYVEWLNVTGGFDAPYDWITGHNEIIRQHAAWVGVSAQAVGVEGGPGALTIPGIPAGGGLKSTDPERYASLNHPGDGYSYDIFSQAGTAVRGESTGPNPLAGYDVQRVIAMGQSQAAFRLTSYANAVQPIAHVYDALLIHSRGGSAAALTGEGMSIGDPTMPDGVRIRDDLDVPVMVVETESDLVVLGYVAARQPDSERFRLWELAGTAHIDGFPSQSDTGDGQAELAVLDPAKANHGPLNCPTAVNAGVQQPIFQAVLASLDRWVRDGTPPPEAPRIETTGTGKDVAIVRDELGIAIGGVRTPLVDVPLAANTGGAGSVTGSGGVCTLFGTSTPLDPSTLARLYPDGEDDYVEQFDKATDSTVSAGFWLEPEADKYRTAARQIAFG